MTVENTEVVEVVETQEAVEGSVVTEGAEKPAEVEKPEFKAIDSQDALDKIVQDRLARERKKFADHDKYKDAYEKMAAVEAQQAEAEKQKLSFEERAKVEKAEWDAEKASLTGELESLRAAQLRSEVAAAKGVPANLIDRLKGDTKDELEADADALLALVNPARTPVSNRPEPTGGGKPKIDPVAQVDKDLVDRIYQSMI